MYLLQLSYSQHYIVAASHDTVPPQAGSVCVGQERGKAPLTPQARRAVREERMRVDYQDVSVDDVEVQWRLNVVRLPVAILIFFNSYWVCFQLGMTGPKATVISQLLTVVVIVVSTFAASEASALWAANLFGWFIGRRKRLVSTFHFNHPKRCHECNDAVQLPIDEHHPRDATEPYQAQSSRAENKSAFEKQTFVHVSSPSSGAGATSSFNGRDGSHQAP